MKVDLHLVNAFMLFQRKVPVFVGSLVKFYIFTEVISILHGAPLFTLFA